VEIKRGDVFLDKRRLVHKIGSVGEEYLREIEIAIKVILGLE
jgi:mRNA-degrading endonuclease toxin of MazEF toxin-antitoxin module